MTETIIGNPPYRNIDSTDFMQMVEEWEQEGIVESIDIETLKLLKEFYDTELLEPLHIVRGRRELINFF